MAAGFRSPFFIWVGGLSAPGGSGPEPPDPDPTVCICPSYTRDGSVINQWISQSCDVGYSSLPYTLPIFRLYVFTPETESYTQSATLTNAWQRKACE
jgi:hypothetical protein